MAPRALDVLHSSARTGEAEQDRWRTPRVLFDALDQRHRFDCDAAAMADSALCPAWFGPDHPDPTRRDALGLDVRWGSRTFVNPPYSRFEAFMARANWEAVEHGASVWALVFARTSNDAWWRCVLGRYPASHRKAGELIPGALRAAQILWVPGRLQFGAGSTGLTPKSGSAPAPSVVVHWSPNFTGLWPTNGVLTRAGRIG